jgi:hypothetical protein
VFGVSDIAVQPVVATPGVAEQPLRVPRDWLSAYAVGAKGFVQDKGADVAVTDPVVRLGAVRVAAWARPSGPVALADQ